MKNFWETLPKPFFVLAPMANVTDAAFRRIIAKYGKPDVMYTEFVSADGLALAHEEGRQRLLQDLEFTDAERPIVAQFFTATPEYMEQAAALAQKLGFDGIDINMGCPDKSVEGQGAGSKLILNPARAVELIEAAKRGAPNIPVSVKTRLGYNKDILEEPARPDGGWLPTLLRAEPAAIIIHARTRKEMSKVPARWERIKRAVEIRNELGSKTLIIGNGDVVDMDDARAKAAATGADGVMIGRAIFGNPWLFAREGGSVSEAKVWKPTAPSALRRPEDSCGGNTAALSDEVIARLLVAIEHTKLYEELLVTPPAGGKSFALMKKHFKAYVEGFPGAKELRVKLMETTNAQEVETIIRDFLGSTVY